MSFLLASAPPLNPIPQIMDFVSIGAAIAGGGAGILLVLLPISVGFYIVNKLAVGLVGAIGADGGSSFGEAFRGAIMTDRAMSQMEREGWKAPGAMKRREQFKTERGWLRYEGRYYSALDSYHDELGERVLAMQVRRWKRKGMMA